MKRCGRAWQSTRGFTLIELMVVVVIIGVLSALAWPTFEGQVNRAKVGRAAAEVKSLMSLVELYKIEHDEYPAGGEFVNLVQENGYPNWGETGEKAFLDPWENPYKYSVEGKNTKYFIWSDGPKGAKTNGILGESGNREPKKDEDTSGLTATTPGGGD